MINISRAAAVVPNLRGKVPDVLCLELAPLVALAVLCHGEEEGRPVQRRLAAGFCAVNAADNGVMVIFSPTVTKQELAAAVPFACVY